MTTVDVLAAVEAARIEVEHERKARRKATLILAGSLVAAGLLVSVLTGWAVNSAAAEREDQLREQSVARAIANCEAINRNRQTILDLLNALLDVSSRRDEVLPLEDKKRAEVFRAEARRIAAERLAQEDCSTRRTIGTENGRP